MTSPTPSLPASIREALDKYAIAVALYEASGSPLAEQDMDERKAALEAHLLALVADAERLDWLDDVTHQYQNPEFQHYGARSDYWLFVGKRRAGHNGADVREAIDAARTPPEDTTPHE